MKSKQLRLKSQIIIMDWLQTSGKDVHAHIHTYTHTYTPVVAQMTIFGAEMMKARGELIVGCLHAVYRPAQLTTLLKWGSIHSESDK